MEFDCKYAKPSGEIVNATLVGQTLEEVRHHLQEQGLLPISVRQKGWALTRKRERGSQIKTEDFIVFNQQFSALIKAGLPILRSLDLLKAQIKNPILRRHVTDVRDRVHSGAMLSEALRAQGVFPTVYTASIFAGERSGDLVNVINRHIHYEKTVMSVRKRFLNSLIYPAFLVVLAIAMVAVILTFVIPKFSELYRDLNVELPLPTTMLILVANTIQSQMFIALAVIVGGTVGLWLWAGTAGGRRSIDAMKLRVPVFGNLWTMFSMAQLSRTLAMLLQGGTPLLSALETTRDASGNSVISSSIGYAIGQVREGKSLSDSLEKTGHFPALSLEMMRVGEQTGSLPEMLNHVADFYDEDVNIKATALLSYIEPAILIFVAGFVAYILISLYLPIFSLGAKIQS
ncbi:MAG TPA: type II secretion system F family protein [Terriglobia bacterium]|nr:type II secretion system F family protein [Terriglobia bacterium]